MWSLWTLEYYSALEKEGSSETVWACAQSGLTLCDPVDCSPPGSSVQKILQARRVEWAAISSSKTFWARDPTGIPVSLPLAGGFFTTSVPGQPSDTGYYTNEA